MVDLSPFFIFSFHENAVYRTITQQARSVLSHSLGHVFWGLYCLVLSRPIIFFNSCHFNWTLVILQKASKHGYLWMFPLDKTIKLGKNSWSQHCDKSVSYTTLDFCIKPYRQLCFVPLSQIQTYSILKKTCLRTHFTTTCQHLAWHRHLPLRPENMDGVCVAFRLCSGCRTVIIYMVCEWEACLWPHIPL